MEGGRRFLLLQDAATGSLYPCLEHLQIEVDPRGGFLAKFGELVAETAGEDPALACPGTHCRLLRSWLTTLHGLTCSLLRGLARNFMAWVLLITIL